MNKRYKLIKRISSLRKKGVRPKLEKEGSEAKKLQHICMYMLQLQPIQNANSYTITLESSVYANLKVQKNGIKLASLASPVSKIYNRTK